MRVLKRNRVFSLCLSAILISCLCPAQIVETALSGNWKFRKKGDKEWLPAKVPGTVHTDLLANKKIPDPFLGTNEKDVQWVENEDWEYVAVFSHGKPFQKSEHVELTFQGLDTYAKIFLNDSILLETDNMFRTWTVDVKRFLKDKNVLRIEFASAVKRGRELAKKLPYTLPGEERVFTRKAQYQYGWDFGPRLVTCGIWKPVKLIGWSGTRIRELSISADSVSIFSAKVTIGCVIECDKKGKYRIGASTTDGFHFYQGTGINTDLEKGTNEIKLDHVIENPRLWWSNGLGKASLYDFTVSVVQDEKVHAERNISVGLRKIELVRQKDSIGESFYFKLNDVPVFMKGANFIPPGNFLPKANGADYKRIVQNAVDANINMLRVWGGGVYADDEFYKQCDKKGILVWQDLMFACAMYPVDSGFVSTISSEIVEQVQRLRNHPCLALWCGNNEIDEGWNNWGWQKQYHYSATDSGLISYSNRLLFSYLAPAIIEKNDKQKWDAGLYLPSSPGIGWGHKESLLSGDSHYWGVWWGMEPFETYNEKVGRFSSEFGFQSLPEIKTLKKCCGDSIGLNSPCLKQHQKHVRGFETMQEYMQRDYKVPKRFVDYVYVSQLLQARGLETAIEAQRRAKPRCMGSLYWQFNDCWPGVSWSTLDHYGNWKAGHYAVKKAFETFLISVEDKGDSLNIFIVSDSLKDCYATLSLELLDFNGKQYLNKKTEILVPANSSKKYISLAKSVAKELNKNQLVLNCTLSFKYFTKTKITRQYYFSKPKDLELQKPNLNIKWLNEKQVEVKTDMLAKNVFLHSEEKGIFFSDNYFDLLPGEARIIRVKRALSGLSKIQAIKASSLVIIE